MKPNTDNDTTANLKGANASRRMPPRRNVEPPTAILRDELALRAWENDQRAIEDKRNEAWSKYPPGTKLFVTTARGIPRRGRAGVVFSKDARSEVVVVGLDDDQILELRNAKVVFDGDLEKAAAKAGVTKEDAIAARSGNAVSPMGAQEIAEDDGLSVFHNAGDRAQGDRDEELDTLRSEIAKRDAEIVRLRKGREANPTAPTRLGQGPKDAAAAGKGGGASEDFGGSDADKK